MAALVHDLAHVPYGHTLENELGVLKEHHDGEARMERFFSRLQGEVEETATPENAKKVADLLVYAKRTILTIKVIDNIIKGVGEAPEQGSKAPLPPEEWFVADIIGNTICADLLDYVRRDMNACGINQVYDDRIFTYFELAKDERNRTRLAVRVTKDQGPRLDAVSEVLNVLRMRYTLSERVLFHHTKNVASAMLGEALGAIEIERGDLDELTDDQLLPWIRERAEKQLAGTPKLDATRKLLDGLERRLLHKPVFRIGPQEAQAYQVARGHHLGDEYSKVDARQDFQDRILEEFPQLDMGDVIVYCPSPRMTMKEVWVHVLTRKDVICRPLREEGQPYLPAVVEQEVQALEEKYKALWSWNVMLAPDKLSLAFSIQAFIQHKLKVANDPYLQRYLGTNQPVAREIADRAEGDWRVQAKAVEIAEEQMLAASGPPDEQVDLDELVRRARDELYPRSDDA